MYQFFHVDVYARVVPTKTQQRRNAKTTKGSAKSGSKSPLTLRQVLDEAKRAPGSCPHIINPMPPQTMYGEELDVVEKMANFSTFGITDPIGRKLRIDTPILLAGVTSYPRQEHDENPLNFDKWVEENIKWLSERYGDSLKNVTLHLDEEHPHLHFYCVSATGSAKDLHDGYLAQKMLGAATSTEKNKVYIQAMRQLQDDLYNQLSYKFGMLRDGPKRIRLSNSEHKARKKSAKILASKNADVESTDQTSAVVFDNMYRETLLVANRDAALQAEQILQAAKAEADGIIKKAKELFKDLVSSAEEKIKTFMLDIQALKAKVAEQASHIKRVEGERDMLLEEAARRKALKN